MNHSDSKIRPLDYLALFLDSREERNCVPETIRDYRIAVTHFLNAPFLPADLADLTPLHLDSWCSRLRKEGKSDATRHWYQQNVRTFLRWLYKKRVTPSNLADEIEPVKVASRHRPQVSGEEMAKVMAVAEARLLKDGTPVDTYYRDIALLRLLWATGIRRAGIARLAFADVDLEGREIHLPVTASKTRHAQAIPFDTPTKRALRLYFVHERGDRHGPLFLNRDGEPMTPNTIHQVLKRLSEKAGVTVRCHGFRRALVRRVRVAGFDLGEAAALVGHRSMEMTRIYSGDGESEAMIDAYRRLIG